MRECLSPLVILIILTKVFLASCQKKGSLTFVIDNTGSMGDDIQQVKLGADAITKIVFDEKASQIKNMVLVTFNDPHAKLEIETENRDYLKRHINDIYVHNRYGNFDCAEPSMKGVLLGLEKSLPGSFMYVFTDASSKDFWKSRDVMNICQKKQIQITFVLTGYCYGRKEKGFKIYHDIATACSGLAFDINKDEVNKVLDTIKETIKGNKSVVKSVTVPPGKYTDVPFVIDDQTEYAIVTVSGAFVSLVINGPSANQERILWIDNGKAIKLSDPTPGQYIASVKGQTETSVYIVGRTDFLFSHGFSLLEPKTISDTTPQPIANAETHLSIAVTDPKHTVTIVSAQILDMNENVLKTLSLKQVGNDFYTTIPFVAPSDRFKIAVNGKAVRNGKDIRRIAKIPVTPQEPPKPKSKKPIVIIKEGPIIKVEYGSTVRLTCKISAYPQPTIKWQNGRRDTLPSQSAVVEPPYDYLSYVTIAGAAKGDTYSCYAENNEGTASNSVEVVVNEPFNIKSKVQGITEFKYGSKGTLTCDITSSVPISIHWTYEDEKTKTSEQIVSSNKYEISADGKQLYINNMLLDIAGKYTCKATLDKDPSKFVSFSTHVKITGLMPPKVTGVPTVTAIKGSNIVIECKISGGVPKPTISWKFMPKDKTRFVSRPGSDNVLRISNVGEKYAGRYKCIAQNDAGVAEHDTILTVHVPPTILSSSSVNYTSVEDTDAQMWIPCVVTGLPKPTITWKVNGVTISRNEKYSIEDDALIVKNPKMSDSQTYTCEATNAAGSVNANFQTNVLQKPKISADTSKIVAKQGQTVNIQCKIVKGVPKPTIAWQFMAEGDVKFVSLPGSENVFHISSVDVTHSGRYKCVAHNDVGDAEHSTTLTVLEAPKISMVGDITVRTGSNVQIECKVIEGVPSPTISWQFMGKYDTKFVAMSTTGRVLHLSKVNKEYTGRYKCIARNVVGTAENATSLTVQYTPIITSKTNIKYKGLEGDIALRIPCDTAGEPKATIAWKVSGNVIVPNAHYSIVDGALIIKHPKRADSNSYICVAKNSEGVTEVTFDAEIDDALDDYGTIKKINILRGTSKKLECGSNDPEQSVRWFMEGNDLKINKKHIYLQNVDDGNYTCRVSEMNGAHTFTYRVIVGDAPIFVFEQEDPVFEWNGSAGDNDMLDCGAESKPPADIVWEYNGIILKDEHSPYLSVDGNWGHYICNVSNVHGAIQKNFEVVSSQCFIKRKPNNYRTMPIMLTQELTWPVLDSTEGYLQLAPGETVKLSCPAHKGTSNIIKGFTSLNEINASCDKQDILVVNGERYKVTDLHCAHEVNPIVNGKHGKCLTETSDFMRVGYDIHGFLETYAVCFDTSENIPLYTRVLMSKSNLGREVTHSWYKYPGIISGEFDRGYTCANSTSSCCCGKRQLVNARDLSDGPAQRSAYIDTLNSIPYWRPCEESKDPWDNIENMVRSQLSVYPQFIAWSGVHTLQQKYGKTVPRYLWKVLRFDDAESIAVVYINDPLPSKKDVLCPNVCVNDNVPWMRDLDERTYCCNLNEFLQAFGLRGTSIGESMEEALSKIMSKQY